MLVSLKPKEQLGPILPCHGYTRVSRLSFTFGFDLELSQSIYSAMVIIDSR